ncbi:MAG: hypothetical protein HY738_03380 [Bacteroidia bacterium]|nr:hypothetical protein [Bacteroidia bacterium]
MGRHLAIGIVTECGTSKKDLQKYNITKDELIAEMKNKRHFEPAIKKVAEIIDEAQITPEERNNAKIDESRKIAKEIYIKFAKRERDVEIAKKMKDKGYPINEIIEMTDLTQNEIENL